MGDFRIKKYNTSIPKRRDCPTVVGLALLLEMYGNALIFLSLPIRIICHSWWDYLSMASGAVPWLVTVIPKKKKIEINFGAARDRGHVKRTNQMKC